MTARDLPHIFVDQSATIHGYASHASSRGRPKFEREIDRHDHGNRLILQTENAVQQGLERRQRTIASQEVESISEGVYLSFDSWPRGALNLSVLDPRSSGPQPVLVAVRDVGEGVEIQQRATVFVPDNRSDHFVTRFREYMTRVTEKGNPRHAGFVELISDVSLATVESLWTEPGDFPETDGAIWWEVWLRNRGVAQFARFRDLVQGLGMEVADRRLTFDDRIITLVQATALDLAVAMDVSEDLAELRPAIVTEAYGVPGPVEQVELIDGLVNRMAFPAEPYPYVCLLDSGVNRGHTLLKRSLLAGDVHACKGSWGTYDHDGHGTRMAGLALFFDVADSLRSTGAVEIVHGLESVKILPRSGYGGHMAALTGSAVQIVENAGPGRRRSLSMSINRPQSLLGRPSSWSAVIDGLAVGRGFDPTSQRLRALDNDSADSQRLFVVSAGNASPIVPTGDHLARSDVEPIQDPAQAWNALTVGAYTELTTIAAPGRNYKGWTPMAPAGELSPFSTTSVGFERSWPIKPDVVLEGGNAAVSPRATDVEFPDSMRLLTTSSQTPSPLLTTTAATSAATAQASCLAARVTAAHPELWPETIRALIVHSARWTPAMLKHFDNASSTRSREALVRRYGFGVPDEQRALWSAKNELTLVVQDVIRPFAGGRFRDMHIHKLPWPKSVLEDLADKSVELRFTLSYFIEPNLTARGFESRFQYASHGLRFHLKHPFESDEIFRKRLNKEELEPHETKPPTGDDPGWYFGAQTRVKGSIHSDFWNGTALELASRDLIAVVPVTGWWKENRQRDKSDLGVRYSLVVSITTDEETADLWTPVAQQVGVAATIES